MRQHTTQQRMMALLLSAVLCAFAGCSPASPGASSVPSLPSTSTEPDSSSGSSVSISQAAEELAAAASGSTSTAESLAAGGLISVAEASEPVVPAAVRDNTPTVYSTVAAGTVVLGNSSASIDASNTDKGYVMVNYTGSNNKVKMQLTIDGGTTYTYNLSGRGYEAFPLSAGSGTYTLNVYENVSGDQYAHLCGERISVQLGSSLSPFLYPNQYADFSQNSSTVQLGAKLAEGATNDLQVVENVYQWVIGNITYDFDKAGKASAGTMAGYLPSVDNIVSSKTGICFDYAAVMVAMLRSQRIPTKLVVGYAGQIYHAWISVYITDVGWVNDVIRFDGSNWVRMDPTFASSGNSSKDIMSYIGNGSNYNALLVY